jgi:ABC-2 type transport system ATP-binding protein
MQEVEAICDRIVIISKGQIVADDKAGNLQKEDAHQTVYVEFDKKLSKSQLAKIPHVRKVEQVKDGWLLETIDEVDLRLQIAQYAQKENWLVLTLKIEQKTLEEVFKELTK